MNLQLPTSNRLRLLHCNVQGIRGKFIELKELSRKYTPDILIINEAKIDLTTQKFNIDNYDRLVDQTAPHLGTIMYVRRGLRWTQTQLTDEISPEHRRIEGTAIRFFPHHHGDEAITIKSVYIPPGNTQDAELEEEYEEMLYEQGALIIGDQNLTMTALNHPRNSGLGTWVSRELAAENIRLIHANAPSRPFHQGDGILDVAILTGDHKSLAIEKIRQLEDIGSDHLPWLVTLYLPHVYQPPKYREMRALCSDKNTRLEYRMKIASLTRDMKYPESDEDCDKQVHLLTNAIQQALDQVAPLKLVDRKQFLPLELQEMIKHRSDTRRKAWNARRQPNATLKKAEYNRAKHTLARALALYREEVWTKLVDNGANNFSKMWRIQRAMKQPPLLLPTLVGCRTELETIDRLVETAIVTEAHISVEDEGQEKFTPFQPLRPTSLSEIRRALMMLKNKKKEGPDGIRADHLKLGGQVVVHKFHLIMDYVLKTGYFPTAWKESNCIFLHKSGKDHTKPESYRPISLLNIMGKWAERLIQQRILEECSDLIPDHQHGFVKHRGTHTQILRTAKKITDSLEKGQSVAMISTDLSKAFDSINHKGLVKKLQNAGTPNNIIKIIENYLDGRTTRGSFRTTRGTAKEIPHGVPQGSILGPLIFNLYVSDIPCSGYRGQFLSQYADDLCILNAAHKPDDATTRAEWMATEVVDYYHRWGLKCNVTKTECVMFSHKRPASGAANSRGYRNHVQLKGEKIFYKNHTKYLGVIFDKQLSMNLHTKLNVDKAKKVRACLYGIIGYRANVSLETKLKVINACLLPILDYGVVPLLPLFSRTNLLTLERQHRMALKAAAQFSRRLETETLYDMLQQDPWHIRIHDLNKDLLDAVKRLNIPDLRDPGERYTRHNKYNPLLYADRIGTVEFVNKRERSKPLDKRKAPARAWLLESCTQTNTPDT